MFFGREGVEEDDDDEEDDDEEDDDNDNEEDDGDEEDAAAAVATAAAAAADFFSVSCCCRNDVRFAKRVASASFATLSSVVGGGMLRATNSNEAFVRECGVICERVEPRMPPKR
jgi:hypothetical protein